MVQTELLVCKMINLHYNIFVFCKVRLWDVMYVEQRRKRVDGVMIYMGKVWWTSVGCFCRLSEIWLTQN